MGSCLENTQGLADYTIGQRKGLGIAGPEPYYVIEKDLVNNALIIGFKNKLGRMSFNAERINWISGESPTDPLNAYIRIRYKSKAVPGQITPHGNNLAQIELTESLPDITPGQAAVFYQEAGLPGGRHHSEGGFMTTPAFIYSFLVATFLGSAFHFLKGGGGGRFVLLLILSWAGFIVGHLLGSIWGIDFLMIGPVSGGFGAIGSILFLLVGNWFSRLDQS